MSSQPLDCRTFHDLRVEAFKHPLLPKFPGGPVLLDPAVEHLRHKQGDRACDSFDPMARFTRYLEGEWVYFGPKYPHHFGHIMAEMVHRILPSKLSFPQTRRYLVVTTSGDESLEFESLGRTYREVLDYFEIDPELISIINENTVIEYLSLCEQGSNLGGHPARWYLEVLTDYSTRRLDQIYGAHSGYDKVYVSKSKVPHGGTILGERYIEELLANNGFFVFYPEEAPLSLQMDVYRKARELVFSEGSALHGTELLGKDMLDRTFVLIRRRDAVDSFMRILEPRSRKCEMFVDTYFLGTIFVAPETRIPHTEFGVSLLDIDRFVIFCRDHQLASLDQLDLRHYFDAAENDLRAYFCYEMDPGTVERDSWRVGEVRLAFEKVRERFLSGRLPVVPDLSIQVAACAGAEKIAADAWAAHNSQTWLEAARCWEVYRERFPDEEAGFAVGSIALIELGRFYEADQLLRRAMEKFPHNPDVHSNFALVAHERRDWPEAAKRWEALCARFPQVISGYIKGASALGELGRHGDAARLLQMGLEHHPGDTELLTQSMWIREIRDRRPNAQLQAMEHDALQPEDRGSEQDRPVSGSAEGRSSMFDGVVDYIRQRRVSGWVYWPEHPQEHLQVTVRLGEWTVGAGIADQYRADLEAVGIGGGDHSYDITLETDLSLGQYRQVIVEAAAAEGESEALMVGPDALKNAGAHTGMHLYSEAGALLPPVGVPSEIVDMGVLDRYLSDTHLTPDEVLEKVQRDVWPIPHSDNREGYDPSSHFGYWLNGYIDYANILDLAQEHGVTGGRYLDFGGSTGRVFRHFAAQTDAWDVWSCDFNASSVEFNLKHFPSHIRPFLNTSFPSLPLPDGYYDLITACSVFTHIDEAETSWLLELRRVLKIGGLACISIHNAETWREMVPDLLATVERYRPDIANEPDLPGDRIVVTFRNDGDPYKCNTFHSDEYVRQNWGRYFDIRDIRARFLGEQAMVVCQRKE